jgi:16S rRNA A1518/A1519 N6-dimethyltransferase RsmA/KsgA/DIM1 with predicted DNA glycosylase/AP lyase activity
MLAPPGSTTRSRLSVMTQRYLEAKGSFVIDSASFVPAPKVRLKHHIVE